MPRRPTAWKTVCTLAADFHVGDNGKVKLIDPPNRRLTHSDACGHPTITLGDNEYFVADLVARAHLNSSRGRIFFRDGDRQNCRVQNILVINDKSDPLYADQRLLSEPPLGVWRKVRRAVRCG
ncbi:MAG: hypothetical protein QOC62_1595 [Mycobacterium sp.]|jgi:hypothetical protein|nr:hypothetical protein [Mycobacterium sp.]